MFKSMAATALIIFAAILTFGFEARASADRFIVQSNGVMDSTTGLIWSPDGGAPDSGPCAGGKKTWQAAFDYVRCLNASAYLGHSDWRLPSTEELSSLVSGSVTQTDSIASVLNKSGFSNVQASYYWSSSAGFENTAVAVDMLWSGYVHTLNTETSAFVWPVR